MLREKNTGLNKTLTAHEASNETRQSIKSQIIYTFSLYLLISIIGYFTWADGSHLEKLNQSFITLGAVYLIFLVIQTINYSKNSDESFEESIKNQRNEYNMLKKEIKRLELEKQQLVNELNTLTR